MDIKIKELVAETTAPLKKGYWKIMAVSFLMIMLSFGLSSTSVVDSLNELPPLVKSLTANEMTSHQQLNTEMIAMLLTLTGGMLLLSLMIKLVIDVFFEYPLEVGANKMFVTAVSGEKPPMLADLAFAYDADYINTVKVLFLKRLFRDLWMLLFFVPGVIKGYEYRMIPYLLAEDPYLEHKEAFAKSKQMMKGWKKKAFLMDLYFIPLHLFGLLTLGIVEVFYVAPRYNLAKANFYLKIKEQEAMREDAQQA